jgi:hypothetical protein
MSALDVLDRASEYGARGVAARHSRRGFLARMGKIGVALTGVAAIEAATADPALATHVCCHTGGAICVGNAWPNCPGSLRRQGCWRCCSCCNGCGRYVCDCCKSGSCCGNSGYCYCNYCFSCAIYSPCGGPCPC